MIISDSSICPNCGGRLKHYDTVSRIMRLKGGLSEHVKIRRMQCVKCLRIHREIPDSIFPYKQYEAEIIRGVLEGFITSDTYGFEDNPSEMTMKRWKAHRNDILPEHNNDEEIVCEFYVSHSSCLYKS